MITELRIQNFKSWKDTGAMRFAPLTGFFGANSSGKSAILQFLLMLKQTVESADRNTVLAFNGPYTKLGIFRDVVFQHKVPGEICYSLEWTSERRVMQYRNPRASGSIIPMQDVTPGKLGFSADINDSKDEIAVKQFTYNFNVDNKDFYFSMRRKQDEDNAYIFSVNGGGYGIPPHVELSEPQFRPDKSYIFPFEVLASSSQLSYPLSQLTAAFEEMFRDVNYLGPLREYPSPIYIRGGEQPQDVGVKGQNAIPALLAARSKSNGAKDNVQSEERVAHWLKKLDLVHSFKLQRIATGRREYEVKIRVRPGSPEVNLLDVGFGVTNVLPILVLCYYAPEGSTIVLEHPDLHLHPKAQAGLADVLIDAIKTRNVQIILESHSEHLLRRLQRRIAEEKFASEDTALYFCEMGQQGASQLKPLELNEYGYITNWPEDFFGDEMEDLVEQSKATTQREQKKRANQPKDVGQSQEAA